MYNCKKCGENNWKWKADKGLITGYCQKCGEHTNTFKAREGDLMKKKLDEAEQIIRENAIAKGQI